MCCVDLMKSFDGLPSKLIQCGMWMKEFLYLVKAVITLYDGAKSAIGVEWSEELQVKFGCTLVLCFHLLYLLLWLILPQY